MPRPQPSADDFAAIERLGASFRFRFDDTVPSQRLSIEGGVPILFSNAPQDASDDLPGNGCGADMRAAYPDARTPYEPLVTAFFLWLAQQQRSLRMIDVGALWGHTSFVAESLFDEAVLHLFEMNPLTSGVLERNIALNSRSGIQCSLHNVLLSNVDTHTDVVFRHYTARYETTTGSSGGKPLSKAKVLRENLKTRLKRAFGGTPRGTFQTRTMQVARLDTLFANGAFRPDVLKIDVEGSQFDILTGAERLLATARPIVLVEFDRPGAANYVGQSNRQVVALMARWGYRCVWGDHRRRDGTLQQIDADSALDLETNSLGIFY